MIRLDGNAFKSQMDKIILTGKHLGIGQMFIFQAIQTQAWTSEDFEEITGLQETPVLSISF